MLFEGKDCNAMAPLKERQFTVRMDEETYEFLTKEAGNLDVRRSELLRAGFLLSIGQIRTIPSLIKIELEDIRDDKK